MNNRARKWRPIEVAVEVRPMSVALVVILVFSIWCLADQGGRNATLVSKGVGCLVDQSWIVDDIRDLGLHVGDLARVRYAVGTIPGTSPPNTNVVNLIVYSKKGDRAWMLFFREGADGQVTAIRNAYRLNYSPAGWTASEGNGGIATYEAVGKYATNIAKLPARQVKLKPTSVNCSVEE